jgi:regulator of chromosome condensation
MKLYVYGSCESDQFRHPNKLSESKRPICLTNIEKFDLNDDEDDDDKSEDKEQDKKINIIYPNPIFQKSVVKIACGGLHSVVLTSDGKAYTFGCNDEGALGRKGPECIPLPVDLDHPVDMVSAGDNHTMFANSINGIVYFTGNYNYLRG